MTRKTNPKQYPQQAQWRKANMKMVGAVFKKEFVEDYREACKKLGIKQSDPIRNAMLETIEQSVLLTLKEKRDK